MWWEYRVGRARLVTGALVVVVGLLLPGGAAGQTNGARGQVSPPPTAQPDLDRWDATGTIGWHNHQVSVPGQVDRDLYHWWPRRDNSLYAGVALGRYWTENVKTEIEVASGGRSRINYDDLSFIGTSYPHFGFATDSMSQLQVGLVQQYQLFHNAWVHPFIGFGAVATRERHELFRQEQTTPVYDPRGTLIRYVTVPAVSSTKVEWEVRPLITAGLKAYVSHHAFFRADLRTVIGNEVHATNARIGFGFDF